MVLTQSEASTTEFENPSFQAPRVLTAPSTTPPDGALGTLQGPVCTCWAVLWTRSSYSAHSSHTPRLELPWEDGTGGSLGARCPQGPSPSQGPCDPPKRARQRGSLQRLRKPRPQVSGRQVRARSSASPLSPVTLSPSGQEATARGSDTEKRSGFHEVVHAGRKPECDGGSAVRGASPPVPWPVHLSPEAARWSPLRARRLSCPDVL